MSIILDALKKLEQKRHRGSVPDLMTVHSTGQEQSQRQPRWPYFILAALILNVVLLAVTFYSRESGEQAVAIQSVSDEQREHIEGESGVKSGPSPSVASLPPSAEKQIVPAQKPPPDSRLSEPDTEITVTDTVSDSIEPAATQEDDAEMSSTSAEEEKLSLDQEDAYKALTSLDLNMSEQDLEILRKKIETERSLTSGEIREAAEPADDEIQEASDNVVEISQLPPDIKKELIGLSINSHIYSNNPSSRLLNIDGRIVREGETVRQGLKLEEITMSGAIFTYGEHRFRIRAF